MNVSNEITSAIQVRCKYFAKTNRFNHIGLKLVKEARSFPRSSINSNMVLPQIIAAFLALFDAIGLPGNLLVKVTIALERRFHVMRYILLASLAVSDFLFLVLVNSFRIASMAQEKWPYGKIICHLSPFFARYFYFNTVLHLVAVSHERYKAIVKSPLTYDGTITKSKVAFIALIWVIPIPFCIGPFLGIAGRYVYNPELFFCEQGWFSSGWTTMFAVMFLVIPLLVIVILNWSVYKAAKAQANAEAIEIGNLAGSENQQQETSRWRIERKAAVDVSIIIAAFLVCFVPGWVVGICRKFIKSTEVPAKAVWITSSIFVVSSLCNPIIYSIGKRDFRAGVKNVLRRIGLGGSLNDMDNNVITMNNLRFSANPGTVAFTLTLAAALATQHQNASLSPIPEIEEASPNQDIVNNVIGMNNFMFGANLDTVDFTLTSAAALAIQHQDGRLSPISEIHEIEGARLNNIDNNVTGINSNYLTFSANSVHKPPLQNPQQHSPPDNRMNNLLEQGNSSTKLPKELSFS